MGENRKDICLGTEKVELDNLEKTIKIINEVIKDFNLLLQVFNGNAIKNEDLHMVKQLITDNTYQNLINLTLWKS